MSAPKFVSIESQNKIVEDYKKIKNVTKTAKLYNCSKGAIRNILKKHDCETHQRDISTEALIKHSKDIFENHEKYKHLNEVTIRRHAKRLLIHINGRHAVCVRPAFFVGSIPILLTIFICGYNSMVECLVANEIVAGSSPATRSNLYPVMFQGWRLRLQILVAGFNSLTGCHFHEYSQKV